MLQIISAAAEYEDLAIRHGEDSLLRNLATRCVLRICFKNIKLFVNPLSAGCRTSCSRRSSMTRM